MQDLSCLILGGGQMFDVRRRNSRAYLDPPVSVRSEFQVGPPKRHFTGGSARWTLRR